MLPQDPMILLSMINMKLRDGDGDLDELRAALDLARAGLEHTLADAGFHYDAEQKRFR